MHYLYLIFSIVAEVIGTTFLKASNGFTLWQPTVASMLFYCVTFYFMSLCMQTLPVGVVYAIWSGVGIVLISLSAFFIYKQALDLPAIIGIALILLGVLVIRIFSKAM